MKKIPTIFLRDFNQKGAPITREWHPDCFWIRDGEGLATVKWDGTCCMIQDGKFYKRHDCKSGKTAPIGFIPAMEPDANTGHQTGWIEVGDGPEDRWHREALKDLTIDGTFELVGPKVNGNPEGRLDHVLIPHGKNALLDVPRNYDALAVWFQDNTLEGIVWHHPDGLMAKIKRRDFGLPWPIKDASK